MIVRWRNSLSALLSCLSELLKWVTKSCWNFSELSECKHICHCYRFISYISLWVFLNSNKSKLLTLIKNSYNCERFEPRSHFKSRLSLIVRVNVVLNSTGVVDSDWRFDNLCGSHLQSQSELYHVSWWYYTLVIDLIGQLRRDVIGCLSVKPWHCLCPVRITTNSSTSLLNENF